MPATASDLRELHALHQRAKALKDRLGSGPKTVTARLMALATRQASLETARKALQDAKVQLKKKEHSVQSINARIDDYKVKLNAVKKNEEYKAIQNQIANEKAAIDKIEADMMDEIDKVEDFTRKLAAEETEFKAFSAEVGALKQTVESQAAGQKAQLAEIETAIVDAEAIIPEDERERYRRTVKQHGAEAMATIEYDRKSNVGSCSGCFVSVTAQTMNELINGGRLIFCKTCGRILYLAEADLPSILRG